MNSSHTWPSILGRLLEQTDLDRASAAWAMTQLMSGEATEGQMGAFMMALKAKGESVDELAGLVDVMLANALPLNTTNDAVDIVGTGGDLVGTVNISSMASILTSASGVPVLKHGSRSASGKTGSSEMLEALGVRLDLTAEQVAAVFEKVNITFFFAPVFHPAMKFVGPVRKQLGVPTTFNLLGPLANPAQPIATSLGVANAIAAPKMAAEVAARGRTALVFRGNDGLDELTTTSESQIWQVCGGEVTEFSLDPRKFGFDRVETQALVGGDAAHNAEVARQLFAGDTRGNLAAIRDIVVLNAAAGVVAYELAKDPSRSEVELSDRFEVCIERVTATLDSGKAAEKIGDWVTATESVAAAL
ncbi:MAG: anthranilate phosphoribosyltransferase [Micrococcales bacterium]